MKHLYTITEGDVVVMKNVTSKDIKERFKVNNNYIGNCLNHGRKFLGKYEITRSHECNPKALFELEWEATVAPFRKIQRGRNEVVR